MAKGQKDPMKRRHIPDEIRNLASHDYDVLLNAMSAYLAVFTCKPFTESPPTHSEAWYYERLRFL